MEALSGIGNLLRKNGAALECRFEVTSYVPMKDGSLRNQVAQRLMD